MQNDVNDSANEPTDRVLLQRYLDGQFEAFDVIVERHEAALIRYASRYTPSGAQDLVQEAFLRLVRQATDCLAIESLSAWLYRVTKNLAIDEARKESRMNRRHQAVAMAERATQEPDALESGETADVVSSKLHGLPPKQRDVLILKLQEEKSYREISQITGLTISYVGYLVHHGLRNLARELRAAGVV